MSIKDTRSCIRAILDGSINESEFQTTNTFRFNIPLTLKGVDSNILNPRNAWADKDAYLIERDYLAGMFIKNFEKYNGQDGFDFSAAGPKVID